ncbi:hypothetical protein E4T56_gene18369 [Termitomyces sp. T112]|nr:hypothetical protein E4T56_gene18369 [Termitomyces sp. T112]
MPLMIRQLLSRGTIHQTSPTPSVTSETSEVRETEYTLSEAQRDHIFQESLRDFWRKFEAEEEARSVGERTREDEFGRTREEMGAIFRKNQRRQEELYKETSALLEERSKKADAAREAIFAQGQTDRARAFGIDHEMRGKRAEWYNAARQELVGDGRQRLKDKCAVLNAALMEQFERLMKSHAPRNSQAAVTVEPVYPWRTLTSSPPLSVAGSRNSSPTRVTVNSIQPGLASTNLSDDHAILSLGNPRKLPPLRQTLSTVTPSSYHVLAAITSGPHSPLNPTIQPTSTESCDQQEKPLHSLTEQGDPKGNTNESYQVVDDDFYICFTHSQKQRQETFLKDESERERQFQASEAAWENRQSQRSSTFERKKTRWSRKSLRLKESQTRQFHGREEERSRGNVRRSTAFKTSQEQYSQVFDMSLSHIIKQAEAEVDLEEVWFKCQKGMLLALYKSQANQLADANHRQLTSSYATMLSTWLLDSIECVMGRLSMYEDQDHEGPEHVAVPVAEYMEENWETRMSFSPEAWGFGLIGTPCFTPSSVPESAVPESFRRARRWHRPIGRDRDASFTPSAMFRAGAFVQNALPIPHIAVSANSNTPQRIGGQRRMHGEFEESQELRAKAFEEGANERDCIHTINEAKRGGEFAKAQQKRKEDFDEAEESRESEFQDDQERREFEFQANELKREEDFLRDEMERNVQARKAQEDREERFQSTMSTLQRNCVEANERRLEELEAWGQELMKSREQI